MKKLARLAAIFASVFSFISPYSALATIANPAATCAGANCTVTFSTTNDYYEWTVPSGVTSITVDAKGAKGGNTTYGGQTGTGGSGGRVTATLTVTPGAVLRIYVGGQGGNNTVGGYNGGGSASGVTYGGSGGGASDIRVTPYGLANRILVAGGGGGSAGGSYTSYGGGAGGGLTGQTMGYCGGYYGGGGGTQSAGGAAGTGYNAAGSGSFGQGGNSANYTHSTGGGGGYYGGGGGSVCGGGGGSSYTNAGLATSVTHYQGVNAGTGSVAITYLNAPIPTTFSTSQTTPANISTGTTISYALVLSQSVSDLAVGDFQLGGTSSCNTPGLSGSTTTYTVTLTNCTEGTVILQLKANSVTGTSAGPPTVSSANTIVIDRTAPTIETVTAPSNSTYIPTNTPTFTVAFNESVTVTGTPRLTLTVGTTTKYANYISMTDSKTALFRYTVGSATDEFDTDGIAVSTTLDLNGGAIADLATNALSALTFTAPTLTGILVAQPAAAPTIDSITATNATLTVYFTPGAARGSTTSTYHYTTDNGSTYKVRASGATASPLVITTVSASASSLVNGTGYQIRLKAITNAGNSDASTAVTETPTAISVTGDATLVLAYGNSASTSAYSGSGGSGSYTWSLGSSISGVTLSGTTVTASSSLGAGTYSQTIRATDNSTAQVGTKSLTITVNKASTSISIALPGSATTAAASGTITITATVPRAGSVNFQLGGATISGCGTAAAASTTATCSWTAPGTLGSVNLTAIFTPTDSSNYETSTSTTLTVSVVNGVSTVSLSLTGGVTQAPKGQAITITAAIDQAGKVTFYVDGKKIPGCINKSGSIGNVICSWKPAVQKQVTLKATLNPTNNVYQASTQSMKVQVIRRTGTR